MKLTTLLTTLFATALIAGPASAAILIDNDFNNPTNDGVNLENAGLGWTKTSTNASLQIGNGADMPDDNSPALGWVNSWTLSEYENAQSYTLQAGESFDVSWRMRFEEGDANSRFYRFRIQLFSGTDFVRLQTSGDYNGTAAGTDPGLTLWTDLNGSTTDESAAAAFTNQTGWGPNDNGAIIWGRMTTDANETKYYESTDGVNWTQVGTTVNDGLGEIDNVALWGYPLGFWGGMDDLTVQVIPEPASMMLMGAGALAMLARRRRA